MKNRALRLLSPFTAIILFAIALTVLHHELHQYTYHDIAREIHQIPGAAILTAILFTVLNYVVLCFYEISGFRYIKNKLQWWKIALTSFAAYAFSNNVGFYSISGSAVRYRLYSGWGLSTIEITRLIAFAGIIVFWLGLIAFSGIVFTFDPAGIPSVLHLPFTSIHLAGYLFLSVLVGTTVVFAVRKKPIRIGNWEFEIPSIRLFSGLMFLSCLDWGFFCGILYALLPGIHSQISFLTFAGMFLLAMIAGLISHVPGGLGVFETVFILLMPSVPHHTAMSALLVFRGLYYILPLCLASIVLVVHTIIESRRKVGVAAKMFGRWGQGVVPYFFGILTFIAGAVLLFSGATPEEKVRFALLIDIMPLPILEISHFLGSMAGVILLVLSWGIYRRFEGAYHLTICFLTGGILFSLLKGLDYEEATILAAMLLIFLPCKSYFYRTSAFIKERATPGWYVAIIAVVLGSVWLGFFSYKHVDYSNELWWKFSFHGHASRFLRASVGVIMFVFTYALYKLISPSRPKRPIPRLEELERVRALARSSPQSSAQLALLGDKSFLLNEKKDAFIMYAVEGRSWISMGDPVGPAQAKMPLIWEFRELCDHYGGRTVFYQVGKENIHCYLDIGLTLLKIGEEGRIYLPEFSLDGHKHKSKRYLLRKFETEGYDFEIIPQENVEPLLPVLKTISDVWLKEKNTREKRFSLGNFNEFYLKENPIAIVRKGNDLPAFANIWKTDGKEELSIDLMRYLPDAPAGVMEYLFTQLILWGKENGYKYFNIGMAPFSGLNSRDLAPVWHKLGSFLFKYGENFYNFQGLRQYKEKFDPVWEPCYLAAPGGLSIPLILKDISSLNSGGLKGVITK